MTRRPTRRFAGAAVDLESYRVPTCLTMGKGGLGGVLCGEVCQGTAETSGKGCWEMRIEDRI